MGSPRTLKRRHQRHRIRNLLALREQERQAAEWACIVREAQARYPEWRDAFMDEGPLMRYLREHQPR